jgi:hypothetical protein
MTTYTIDTGDEVGWISTSAEGRPLLARAEPDCPTDTVDTPLVVAMAYVRELERRSCFPGELTIGPVQAGPAEEGWAYELPDSKPPWLAPPPTWRLYGPDGRQGLDRGLPVALAPSVGESLPMDGWLTIRGHFDDPASATCSWSYQSDGGGRSEPPEVQVRRCRDRFVVTSVEPADAPS